MNKTWNKMFLKKGRGYCCQQTIIMCLKKKGEKIKGEGEERCVGYG